MLTNLKYTVALIAGAQALDLATQAETETEFDWSNIASDAIGGLADAAGGKKPYRCGSIATLKAFKYGRFAGRIYNPNKNGTVVSLFTYWMGATM